MPKLYLDPPVKPGAEYPNGGNEQYWINKIADAMKLLFPEYGVEITCSAPNMSEKTAIRLANAENCDLYLALRSRQAPAGSAGPVKGLDVCYYEYSAAGKQAAETFAGRLKEIYPEPGLVGARPSTGLPELRETQAPALLIKLIYHDNPQDEAWLTNSTDQIAGQLVKAAAEFLGVPENDHA